MITYMIKRLGQALLVTLAVSFICFVIFQYTGNPVWALVGKYATQEQQDIVVHKLGLDKPFYVQYVVFLKNILHGNFGMSYVARVPVLGLILERLAASIELAASAMLFAVLTGTSLGALAALHPRALSSRLIMAGSLFGISLPTFLTGILLGLVFAVQLRVLPAFGRGEVVRVIGNWRTGFLSLSGLSHLVLPAATLSLRQLAMILRLTRAGMAEAMREDYVRTAWAKGLRQGTVVFKHALRNVLIPIVTMIGLQFGSLLAFATITETIFQWPGVGNLLLFSIYESDNPTVVAYIMLVSVIIVLLNLLVDLSYGLLDPRVRYV